MKTAEEVLKSKLDVKIAIVNTPDYTFNKVIEAMEEYAEYYHKTEVEKLNKANVSGSFPCHHNFIQKDTYWKSCTHCELLAPLGQ